MASIYGIVVAGGQGTRIGFRKQYTLLAGVPMWARSTHALFAGGAQRVFVVVPEDDIVAMESSVAEQPWASRCSVVAGGDVRAASVRNGLQAVTSDLGDPTAPSSPTGGLGLQALHRACIVLIHDAARPFVTASDVQAIVHEAQAFGAAILASPCKDTVKSVVTGAQVAGTVPREQLWMAQTPQGFQLELLLDAYQKWRSDQVPTDDSAVMEAAGYPVKVVISTGINIKVTTREDLEYAAWQAERLWGDVLGEGVQE